MNAFSDPSPPSSPSYGSRRRRGIARRIERYCCNVLTYFPLLFVYGLTTWAVWVEAGIGLLPADNVWTGYFSSFLGIVLYVLTNWSYTTAVFTDPGSPMNMSTGYSHLPTHDGQEGLPQVALTVKSTGEMRYCKKCQSKKPDRAHHCSTCRRCVLKMDHHCPWLATCVGLRNYKPFLLFCIYVSLFCWICFAVSATWVWGHVVSGSFDETLMPVNYIMLSVLSGIFGLVLSGFSAWHVWLASSGQTTIENLEKTRYLSPIKRHMEHQLDSNRQYMSNGRPSYSQQLQEIHANALPGITRPEEGEERTSPAHDSLRRNYAEMEMMRERDRYQEYLDEQDSEKLPNAFDLGWQRNLLHVFGSNPLLWFLPVCNTTGDGWYWEPSSKWLATRDRIARERQAQLRHQQELERAAGWGPDPSELPRNGSPYPPNRKGMAKWDGREDGKGRYLTTSNGVATVPMSGRRSPGKADQILGRAPREWVDGGVMSAPRRKKSPLSLSDDEDEDGEYEDSSDEEVMAKKSSEFKQMGSSGKWGRQKNVGQGLPKTENWNDIPEDMLGPSSKAAGSGIERPSSGVESRGKKGKDEGDGWDDWKPT